MGVTIYDAETTKIVTSKPPVLKGWRDTISRLWKTPLAKQAPSPDNSLASDQAPATCAALWTPGKLHSPIPPTPT